MPQRNLRITSCQETYRGQGKNGEFVIYEVEAVNADNNVLINLPLRSFEHLNEGESGVFDVKPYEKTGKPTTYTLSKPKSGGHGGGNSLGPKLDDVRKRVEMLEQNYEIMKRAVAALEDQIKDGQIAHPVAAGPISPNSGGGGTPPNTSDDDIPF